MDENNSTQQDNTNTEQEPKLDNKGKFRRQFLQVLFACLLASSGVAVVAVLSGGFTEVLTKALWTILLMAIHTILSLGYVNYTTENPIEESKNSSEFFSNLIFGLIVASFVTSILGVWGVFNPTVTGKMYGLYGVLLFADIHAELLYRLRSINKNIDNVIYANYGLMAVVVIMIAIVIFSPDLESLGSVFYRILAAFGILDTTATLAAAIMYKMHLQKHPDVAKSLNESSNNKKSLWRNPLIILLLIWLAPQLIFMVISLILGVASGF